MLSCQSSDFIPSESCSSALACVFQKMTFNGADISFSSKPPPSDTQPSLPSPWKLNSESNVTLVSVRKRVFKVRTRVTSLTWVQRGLFFLGQMTKSALETDFHPSFLDFHFNGQVCTQVWINVFEGNLQPD